MLFLLVPPAPAGGRSSLGFTPAANGCWANGVRVNHNGNVCRRPLNRCSSPLRGGAPALQSRALIDEGFLHVQIVDVHEVAFAFGLCSGIVYGRTQRLVVAFGFFLLRELENRVGLSHPFAADLVDDQAHLACALPIVPRNCARFHGYFAALARLSANLPP